MTFKGKKITAKAKVLTAVLVILFLGACAVIIYAGMNGAPGGESVLDSIKETADVTTTAPSDTTAATAETSSTAEATTEAATQETEEEFVNNNVPGVVFSSFYDAAFGVDAYGDKVDLSQYFGSGFTSYGGAVMFDGKRFQISMGVSAGDSSTMGKYVVESETELTLYFDNSDIKTAKITTEDGVVTSVEIPMNDIVVTFK